MQDFATPDNTVRNRKLPNIFLGISSTLKKVNLKRFFAAKKIGTFIFIAIVGIAVLLALRFVMLRAMVANSQVAAVPTQTLSTVINQDFSFKAYDTDKKLSDSVQYSLTDAQLTNRIVIKGQGATAVKGRTFLILNLKLVNGTNKSLFLNTRNYVRVQPAGTQDRLAPEIHNDTVEVQPLSTKLTRIGLPVDDTIKEFTLFVGEIDGDKKEIPIKF